MTNRRALPAERFLLAMPAVRPTTVLDVGSGSGKVLQKTLDYLENDGTRVSGIALDLSSAILRGAVVDQRITKLRASCQDIPVPSQSVDLAICMDIIEHVTEPAAAVREIARTSRTALFKIPLERSLYTVLGGNQRRLRSLHEKYGHVHHFNRQTALQILTKDFDLFYESYEPIPNRTPVTAALQRLLINNHRVFAIIFGGFIIVAGRSFACARTLERARAAEHAVRSQLDKW